ncbi:hypothetical protein AB0K00_41560 [Dactylosporangium sp. NPDC049525]|uniref:hypothetical protein n=1 Tax=Dactylosporangium sp. NPDC049525 TaxID=3154730 RepID=UPI00341B24F8
MSVGHGRPARTLALAALRGLAIGVASTVAAAAVAFAIIALVKADDAPCDSDLACLPDLGPLILAVLAIPVAVAVTGPLVARLLRVPNPPLFAIPAAFMVVWACVSLGPARNIRWPFNDLVSTVLILWLPYVLIAVWVSRRVVDAGPPPRTTPVAPPVPND